MKFLFLEILLTIKVSRGTIKIIFEDGSMSSAILLKFERNKKPFHCLMTNEHALTKERIKNKEKIKIKYENEKKELLLELNIEERIILEFFSEFKIDISIVEIIPKDKIDDDTLFLSPSSNINEEYYINKEIQLLQYPKGKGLSISNGKIKDLFTSLQYMFYHDASTEFGSSGGSIILKGEDTVIGIHKGALNGTKGNVGILIGSIIEQLKEYKINNKRKEYYNNGKLKYEGIFENDEYNDNNGIYIDEEGNIHTGKFENGKKNGNFCVIKGDKIIQCEYKDDELVKEESDSKEEDKKENSMSKSDDSNNNNNNKNNNGTSNYFLTKEFWDKVIKGGYSVLKPLGDKIGFKCGCGHEAKSHTEIELGKWECKECPEDNKYCIIKCF